MLVSTKFNSFKSLTKPKTSQQKFPFQHYSKSKNFLQQTHFFSSEKKPENEDKRSPASSQNNDSEFQETLKKLAFSIDTKSSQAPSPPSFLEERPLSTEMENLPKDRRKFVLNRDILEQKGRMNAAQLIQVLEEGLTPLQISEKFGISDRLVTRALKYVGISEEAFSKK